MKVDPTAILLVLVAAIGGIAKELNQYLIRDGYQLAVGRLACRAVVSGFSGYIFASVVQQLRPEWAMACAGIGGYLGVQSLDLLSHLLGRYLEK